MADDDVMADLFGSDSDEEQPQGGSAADGGGPAEAQGELEARQEQQEQPQQQQDAMKDLFGSDSEEEGAAPQAGGGGQAAAAEPPAAQQEDAAAQRMRDVFGSEDEEEEAGPSQRYRSRSPSPEKGPPITIVADLHSVPPAADLRLAKLSNIVAVEPAPFDPDAYELEELEYRDSEGNSRVRLQNTIRWRHAVAPDGSAIRQSNARFVRWSDGSLQLLVGGEALDVKEIDVTRDHNYVFARNPAILQGQGQISTKLVFQPATLTGGTHKRLAAQMDKRHVRQQKVKATTTLFDPEKLKKEREKAEEEAIRSREKQTAGERKIMRRFQQAAPRMTAGFLEEEEEEEGSGMDDELEQAQRARMQRSRFADEAAEAEAERRLAAAKADAPPSRGGGAGKRGRAVGSSEEEEEEEEGEEDLEEEARRQEMAGFIVESEEEDGGQEAAAAAKKKRRVVMDSDSE